MNLYCPQCGAPVERGELNMDVGDDGKVKVSPPKLVPCGHAANPVTLQPHGASYEQLPVFVNDARLKLLKSRSDNVTIDRDTLAVLVEAAETVYQNAMSQAPSEPAPKSVDEPSPATKG